MGLIRAAFGAVTSTLRDQYMDAFYCEALDETVLMRIGIRRGGENKGGKNVITDGSPIIVADGQCMIIVDAGKVVELCAEPGVFIYNNSSSPSVFSGGLKDLLGNAKEVITDMWNRIRFGGGASDKAQYVYYINIKELIDNKFGTPTPVPFRIVDNNIGIDIDIDLQVSGVYSYKIANPLNFYKNVAGNIGFEYLRKDLDAQLKTEFISSLQPALAALSTLSLRPSQLPAYTTELEKSMNEVLSERWYDIRGLKVVSIGFANINVKKEDADIIKKAQEAAMYRDPRMAAATMVSAQADAMRTAAGNNSGAVTGFMGMGMAGAAGGVNINNLYETAAKQENDSSKPQADTAAKTTWYCPNCGTKNAGNFCVECGTKRP